MLGYLAAVETTGAEQTRALASQVVATLTSAFMFWLAFQKVPASVRAAAIGLGVLGLAIDGYALLRRVHEAP